MKKLTMLLPLIACFALGASGASLAATATPAPTPTPAPTAAPAMSLSETQFVDAVTTDLQNRFGSIAAATAAGYFRYTDEDDTGAISWVNPKYWKSDQQHPSQLWYDVKGRLIGADFSVPTASSSSPKPSLWGVSPSRWIYFFAHVHFGIKTGTTVAYGGYGPKTAAKIGGSVANPATADVMKLAQTDTWKVLSIPKPQSAADVAFVFPFPSVWDLQVWLVPNSLGAFAEHNPYVIPSANAAKSGD
jgi:hypothetical protein